MTRSRRLAGSALAVAAVVFLTSCSSDDDTDPSPGGSPTATGTEQPQSPEPSSPGGDTGTPEPGVTSEPPFPANTDKDTGQASADAMLVLKEIRTGTHNGYDRVVIEFTGPGAPGWTAEYVTEAFRQGKGDPITVLGGDILDINATGTTYPEGGIGGLPAGSQAANGSVVKEVFNDGTFEGITHVVIGLTEQKPFRVFAVANPPRIVIDVQH